MRKRNKREAGMARVFPLLFQPSSARDVAEELNIPAVTARHYIRGLVDMGIAIQESTRPARNGTREIVYVAAPGAVWAGQESITGMAGKAVMPDLYMRAMVAYGRENRV